MKKLIQLLALVLVCSQAGDLLAQKKETAPDKYQVVGKRINTAQILSAYQAQQLYGELQPGDSLQVAFQAAVKSVCKKKGCWMNVALDDGREVMVRFKDYAFFVPKDIEGRTVTVHGQAFVTEMSVEDQKHYAQDGGASPEAVAAIKEKKRTLSFLADGVHIQAEQ